MDAVNTSTNGSKMASLDFTTQHGALNVTDLKTPIRIIVHKNPDVGIVPLRLMDPANYGYGENYRITL